MVSQPYRSKSTLSRVYPSKVEQKKNQKLTNISATRFPGSRKYKKLSPDDMNIEYTCKKEQHFELGTLVNLHAIENEQGVNDRPGV